MINALVFHLSLSGRHGMPNFNDACPQGLPVSGLMQKQWHQILDINSWSIFKIAVDLLHGIASIEHADRALDVMVGTAGRVHAFGIADSRYLFDAVFQGSIANHKYLATFYTRPGSAYDYTRPGSAYDRSQNIRNLTELDQNFIRDPRKSAVCLSIT